jgi:hypothetical protein
LVNGELDRQLKEDGARQLYLDPVEFDLLYNYVTIVPWQAGSPCRNAVATIDWMLTESKKR